MSADLDPVLVQIESFLVEHGMSATAFGQAALNDPTLVRELRAGRECKRLTRTRILAFIKVRSRKQAKPRSKSSGVAA